MRTHRLWLGGTIAFATMAFAAAASEPIAIDVVGLRLGMSVAEVEQVFKQRHLDNGIVPQKQVQTHVGIGGATSQTNTGTGKALKVFTFRDIGTGQAVQIKGSEYVSYMVGFHDAGGRQREQINVEFTPLHDKEQLVSIWRHQYYSPGNQPATDTFTKSLQDKYGSLNFKSGCNFEKTTCNFIIWRYNQDGTPIRDPSNGWCAPYNNLGAGRRSNIPALETFFAKCGSIELAVFMTNINGLVDDVQFNAYNRGLDVSAHKEANAIMAAAEKERTDSQMQKARTQKPDF